MKTRRIVVGVDGSEGSQRALEWCVDLAQDIDVEVIAVHSINTPIYATAAAAMPVAAYDDAAARERVRDEFELHWCGLLDSMGVKYRTEVTDGNPAQSLMAIADGEHADMIVVGARGRGGFRELLLGSTSHHVAHHANQPVVIVPPIRS
jgi:nucleotide-binding universal stress UspA family protein